jgi:hypothetical protein
MGKNNNPSGKGGFQDNKDHQNKNGRPKRGKSLTDLLRKELKKRDIIIEKIDPLTGEKIKKKISGAEAVVRQLRDMVIKEKYWPAMRYLIDRIDGRPIEQIIADTELTLKDYTIIPPPQYDPALDPDLHPELKDNSNKNT